MFGHLLSEEFIRLMEPLAVKVALAAPGRARDAVTREEERRIFLGAHKQARHAIAPDSFHGPGRRRQVLHCLGAGTFIDCLYRVVVCDERHSAALVP